MPLTRDVAIMAIQRTEDPFLAAQLADQLGLDVCGTPLLVGLPPEWVLARQKGPVEIAAFAAQNCTDEATLQKLYRPTRRRGVLYALAASRHLPDSLRAQMSSDADERDDWQLQSQLRRAALATVDYDAELRDLLAKPDIFDGDKSLLENFLGGYNTTKDHAETVVAIALKDYVPWVLIETCVAKWSAYGRQAELLARVDVSAEEVYGSLSDADKVKALQQLLALVLRRGRVGVPLDLFVVTEMVAKIQPIVSDRNWRLRNTTFFTSEALDVLVGEHGWLDLACTQTLTDFQFSRAVSVAGDKVALLLPSITSEARVEEFLEHCTETIDRSGVETLLQHLEDDSLVEAIIAKADLDAQVSYLSGQWRVGHKAVTPTVDRLEAMLTSHPGTLDLLDPSDLTRMGISDDYTTAVVDLVPGAARRALREKVMSDYIWEKLNATGCPIDLALDQFSSQPGAPFAKLCRTLNVLSKQ